MDKDRIEGSANQAKGAIKQAAGKVTGDAKLQAEGAADKAVGKVQNAVGGAKDGRWHGPAKAIYLLLGRPSGCSCGQPEA